MRLNEQKDKEVAVVGKRPEFLFFSKGKIVCLNAFECGSHREFQTRWALQYVLG